MLHGWRAPHMVTVRIGDLSVAVPSRSALAEGIYANAWERQERTVLRAAVRPGTTVIDIGANIGFYTCLFAASVGETGRVIAFEPTPSTLVLLRDNVTRNGLANVQIEEVALSDREGTATFHVFPAGGDAYNSLVASSAYGTTAAQEVTVRTRRLDDYLDRIDPGSVSAVKMDVEGAESLVIDGGRAFLGRLDRAVLMVELNESAARQCQSSVTSVVTLLRELGFSGFALDPQGRLVPLQDSHVGQILSGGVPSIDAFFARGGGVDLLRAGGLLG
jgi:FkbM family methyltransferase